MVVGRASSCQILTLDKGGLSDLTVRVDLRDDRKRGRQRTTGVSVRDRVPRRIWVREWPPWKHRLEPQPPGSRDPSLPGNPRYRKGRSLVTLTPGSVPPHRSEESGDGPHSVRFAPTPTGPSPSFSRPPPPSLSCDGLSTLFAVVRSDTLLTRSS